jgi:hypothetical protein
VTAITMRLRVTFDPIAACGDLPQLLKLRQYLSQTGDPDCGYRVAGRAALCTVDRVRDRPEVVS